MLDVHIDCLAGPTHHFGGLAFGNVASIASKGTLSQPKQAALQGLEKMKLMIDLGIPQLLLPPQPRPSFAALTALGFSGNEQEILEKAYTTAPELLLSCSSSSAMWAANSATITPSTDSTDGKLHITVANLAANFHRSIEAAQTLHLFKQIFANNAYFTIHSPLPAAEEFFDEGAANHIRFSSGKRGIHFFVWGKSCETKNRPHKYPARQSKEASIAIGRRHGIKHMLLAQQNPAAIDAGVFHNDVIACGHEKLFLYHEEAYADSNDVIAKLQEMAIHVFGKPLTLVKIRSDDLTLHDAVSSYFFNSQIVTAEKKTVLIAPIECQNLSLLDTLPLIDDVRFVQLNESMKNGGGPACLRLSCPMTEEEFQEIHQGVILTPALYEKVKELIMRLYPEKFQIADLINPLFRMRCKDIDESILQLLGLR